jgi:hypothetical protein
MPEKSLWARHSEIAWLCPAPANRQAVGVIRPFLGAEPGDER